MYVCEEIRERKYVPTSLIYQAIFIYLVGAWRLQMVFVRNRCITSICMCGLHSLGRDELFKFAKTVL
jgi:hypothetical protein